MGGHIRAQSAVDYLISYGIALAIIAVALYIIFSSGILTPYITPNICTPSPGFICDGYTANVNGTVDLLFAQTTGAAIRIYGAGCSTIPNSTNQSIPAYGNIHLLGYSAFPSGYPNNALANSVVVQSDSSYDLEVYCFSSPSGYAKGKLGSLFNGYISINYTILGLNGHNSTRVASITTKYT